MIKKPKIVEDNNSEDYEKVDFENYGKEILKNLGWSPSIRDIRPYEINPRKKGLGLGADQIINEFNAETKSIEKDYYGTRVRIVHGQYSGFKGTVVEHIQDLPFLLKSNTLILVELRSNLSKVKIQGNFLKLKNKSEIYPQDEKFMNKKRERSFKSENATRLKWIIEGILVRIINKDFLKGKYFLQKAEVVNISNETSFIIKTQDNKLHEELKEKDLQTVIPKSINENVKILNGKYRGQIGKMINKDKSKNKITIQTNDDCEIFNFCFDDVSQCICN